MRMLAKILVRSRWQSDNLHCFILYRVIVLFVYLVCLLLPFLSVIQLVAGDI